MEKIISFVRIPPVISFLKPVSFSIGTSPYNNGFSTEKCNKRRVLKMVLLTISVKKIRIVVKTVSYYVPDGNGVAMLSFYTLKAYWNKYVSVFQDAVVKTLK